jgi:branched-chain amino acid transport system permease protein
MGIDVNRTIATAFLIGGVLAGAAGFITAYYINSARFQMGFRYGLFAFTAAVLGGIGNIYGAMIGGLVLGLAESLATAYIENIPGMELLGGGAWKNVWAFVLLILVLLLRPQGLLGERVADRA